jgi:hypothetical protein
VTSIPTSLFSSVAILLSIAYKEHFFEIVIYSTGYANGNIGFK